MNLENLFDNDFVIESWRAARPDNNCFEYRCDQFGIAGGDYPELTRQKILRFTDIFPALCYSFGISRQQIKNKYPQIFSFKYHYDLVKKTDWPCFDDFVAGNFENVPTDTVKTIREQWPMTAKELIKSHDYGELSASREEKIDIMDQLAFVRSNQTRQPKKVLEVGGGRGEIANAFKWLNVECLSAEPGQHAKYLYNYVGKLFFGTDFDSAIPIESDLKNAMGVIDLKTIDTIIFCESIEHIPEQDFWNFWNLVREKFSGRFIITNLIKYHPLLPDFVEHVFEIDDDVYEKIIAESSTCVYREGSHLVVDI